MQNKKNAATLKEIQAVLGDILRQFAQFCDENGLRYFAFGGTCLGAVRHHGFIPWDDDVDVAMPREDYNRLRRLLMSSPNSNLQFVDHHTIEHYECMFAKIQDVNTTKIEHCAFDYPDRWMGISIDIMPLDGLPANKKALERHLKRIRRLHFLNRRMRYLPVASTLKGRLFNAFLKLIKTLFGYAFFSERADRIAMKYRFDTFDRVLHTGAAIDATRTNTVIPLSFFSDYVMMDFGDFKIRVPKDWDSYLSFYYGSDYMTPPEHPTIVHDIVICDVEKSYLDYLDRFNKGELKL